MTPDQESLPHRTPVIAILDVGKTNKKIFLFDQGYKIVYERTTQLPETIDEDGHPCEDLGALTQWAKNEITSVREFDNFTLKAINFSAYGASFVHLSSQGKPLGPLYNYLKPYPEQLLRSFLSTYDRNQNLSLQTASPQLGSLNSGLQLYRLKYEKPDFFNQIKYSLHLPQYLSFLITENPFTEPTSIGCHTMLWDFQNKKYHPWVLKENIDSKFPQLVPSDHVTINDQTKIGVGLHDSSAALIPYLKSFLEPFILISTGTWCISLNPFNQNPLTEDELKLDCLQYLSFEGKAVKASRLFAGHIHDMMIKKMADHFSVKPPYFHSILFDKEITTSLLRKGSSKETRTYKMGLQGFAFDQRELAGFNSPTEAYHQLLLDLVEQQVQSTSLVLNDTKVKKIFVDGGFSTNSVYMNLLAAGIPQLEIYTTSVPQASALGAALAIHSSWNHHSIPAEMITLRLCKRPDGIKIHPVV